MVILEVSPTKLLKIAYEASGINSVIEMAIIIVKEKLKEYSIVQAALLSPNGLFYCLNHHQSLTL